LTVILVIYVVYIIYTYHWLLVVDMYTAYPGA